MEVEQWQELANHLEQLPEFLIWETTEPVWQLRAALCGWDKSSTFIEELLPLMVNVLTDPRWRERPFFEQLGPVWVAHEGLTSGYSFAYVSDAVKAAGLDMLGRIHVHGMRWHGQVLYRFYDLLGLDIRLQKITLYELEELADWESVHDQL